VVGVPRLALALALANSINDEITRGVAKGRGRGWWSERGSGRVVHVGDEQLDRATRCAEDWR
jgi:hypothetical protein